MTLARRSRLLLAAQLTLATALLGLFPHGHPVTAGGVPSLCRDDAHAPHGDPCAEPGAAVHRHAVCAVCSFQRVLSGGRVASHVFSAPALAPVRAVAPPRAAVASEWAAFTDPRGPPAA